jgi:hypothetical protein
MRVNFILVTESGGKNTGSEVNARLLPGSWAAVPYLLRVKSALPSPATVTGLDEFFAPSCQAVTV